MAIATDRASTQDWQVTDLAPVLSARTHPSTGVVTVTGRLTRPGLLAYAPSESPTGKPTIVYRSPKEIFSPAYLQTIKGSVISSDHSFKKVGDPNSGLITRATAVDGFVEFEVMISDQKIADQLFKGVREVSAGYNYKYSPMTLNEIAAAKDEFPLDWQLCNKQLPVSGITWIRATDLRNNHVTVLPRGRAGSSCAIDNQLNFEATNMDPTQLADVITPDQLPASGEIETKEEVLSEDKIKSMFDAVVKMMGDIQAAMNSSALAFDGAAFSADRSGYLGGVLSDIGLEVTDLGFTDSVKLLQAYATGYQAGKAMPVATATDRVTPPSVGRSTDAGADKSDESAAWAKLAGRVSSKKKEIE